MSDGAQPRSRQVDSEAQTRPIASAELSPTAVTQQLGEQATLATVASNQQTRVGSQADTVVDAAGAAPSLPGLTITGELGRGGMGVVWRGRQDWIDRAVAVKVLGTRAVRDASAYRARFQREARTLAAIQHPHVVACYQAGLTPDGDCFLVMELVEGPDLRRWLETHGPLSPEAVSHLVVVLCQALQAALDGGVIHRDVKVENVLCAPGKSAPLAFVPKLADLGLARPVEQVVDSRLTATGTIVGTPACMAPEQFDDPEGVDHRADIYALGCLAFHALTGRPAYPQRQITELVRAKMSFDTPDPAALRDQLPPALCAAIRACLVPDRSQRPATYSELADLVTGRQVAMPARARSRRPLVLAVLAVPALVLAWWGAQRFFAPQSPTEPEPTQAAAQTAAQTAAPTAGTDIENVVATAGDPLITTETVPVVEATDPKLPTAPALNAVVWGPAMAAWEGLMPERLSGWSSIGSATWAPADDAPSAIDGYGSGDLVIPAPGPSWQLTVGISLPGGFAADKAAKEFGLVLHQPTGGRLLARIQNSGAIQLLTLMSENRGVSRRLLGPQPVPQSSEGPILLQLSFSAGELQIASGDWQSEPVPLSMAPSQIGLSIGDGIVRFHDWRLAQPQPQP